MGITLAAASNVVYLNNAYSLNIRQQSEDRTHRPGQTRAVSYFDVLAEGPAGQRTIDHIVLKALREKRELAEWTASAWLEALKEQKG
jgi:SNF2 family DNA or RNA helicase